MLDQAGSFTLCGVYKHLLVSQDITPLHPDHPQQRNRYEPQQRNHAWAATGSPSFSLLRLQHVRLNSPGARGANVGNHVNAGYHVSVRAAGWHLPHRHGG